MGQTTVATLETESLHLWRGSRHVLRGLSLSVRAGECLHVVGANGSGKTSLLRTLAGFLWPEEGVIRWNARPVMQDRDGYARAIAYLGHDNGLKGDLTVRENLFYAAGLRVGVTSDESRNALARVGMARYADSVTRTLSAGQKRRVAIARLLLSDATLWLLDEPFTNIDASGAAELSELVEAHLMGGGLAVVTTHSALGLPQTLVRTLELT